MLRELINRFNRSLSEQMVSARRPQTSPIKVWFDPDVKSELGQERARNACIIGETVDLSKTGIGFTVPAIRVKEKYLVGQLRRLHIEVDLPVGKVYLCGIGRRYEKVGEHISTERFLVGIEITELRGGDKELYEAFLRRGPQRLPKTTGEIRATAG
jgi:hypothetical protein